jgi:GAF domain-containing protein
MRRQIGPTSCKRPNPPQKEKTKKFHSHRESHFLLLLQKELKKMSKQEDYKLLLSQAKAMVKDETDAVANMANVAALIQETFHFWWTGFYRVIGEQLVLGPFQGPVACTRIGFGKGVCGTSWKEKKTLVVEDVEQFPGHIACSSESRSEIVVPLFKGNEVIGVLDIDSEKLATFDETDKEWLEQIAEVVSAVL